MVVTKTKKEINWFQPAPTDLKMDSSIVLARVEYP
jgi:hypothetical protein